MGKPKARLVTSLQQKPGCYLGGMERYWAGYLTFRISGRRGPESTASGERRVCLSVGGGGTLKPYGVHGRRVSHPAALEPEH